MRDLCGLRIRPSPFNHARSHVNRLEPSILAESSEIDRSDMNDNPCHYPLPIADDEFFSLTNASQLDFAENASAGWLKDAISLKRLQWHQPSTPPARSRSCSGRIEASSAYAKCHVRKPLSLHTDCPSVSQSNSLSAPVSICHSRGPIYQEILEFSLCGQSNSGTAEEKNKNALEEKQALEDRTGKPNLFVKQKYENEKATVLPLPVLCQKASKACLSAVPICFVIRKRRSENEDEDIIITLKFKKPRGRIKQPKNLADCQKTMGNLEMERSNPTFKPSTSKFQASKWSIIDQSVFHFVPHNLTHNYHNTTEASSYMSLLKAQVGVKPEPSSFSVKSASPIIKPKEYSYLNTRPALFASCLDFFNQSIASCDAMQRFHHNHIWCLANNRHDVRCQFKLPLNKHKFTKLVELAELNVYNNVQECLEKLDAFISIAVCTWQQEKVKGKVKLLVQTYQSRNSARVISINSDLQTENGQDINWLRSAPMKHESGLNLAWTGEKETEAQVCTPATKVTYWLRKPPYQALHYLPEYQPYYPSEMSPRSVREWVTEQAKAPLFIRNPRATGKFQELDERWDGYLYVYWNRASFGLVKIGCTTISVDRRLQEWEDQCQHLAEEHYRSPFRIKHVARVEKLIHAEFRKYRVYEPFCHGCGRKHIEWFRGLDLGLVIKKIEAWSEWIMKEPYEEKFGRWQLKDGLESDLPQICRTPSEINSLVKESPRYNLRPRRTPGLSQNPSSPAKS